MLTASKLKAALVSVEPPRKLVDEVTGMPADPYLHLQMENFLKGPRTSGAMMEAIKSVYGCMDADSDPVYGDRLLIGNSKCLDTPNYLKRLGIRSVLNVGPRETQLASGKDDQSPGVGIRYAVLNVSDTIEGQSDIVDAQIPLFIDAANTIDEFLSADSNGKVLVSCFCGVSRSASCVAAYMVLKKGYAADEALRTIRRRRGVLPSEQNLSVLARLNNVRHGHAANHHDQVEVDEDDKKFKLDSLRSLLKDFT